MIRVGIGDIIFFKIHFVLRSSLILVVLYLIYSGVISINHFKNDDSVLIYFKLSLILILMILNILNMIRYFLIPKPKYQFTNYSQKYSLRYKQGEHLAAPFISILFLIASLFHLLNNYENYGLLNAQILGHISALVFFIEYIHTQTKLYKSSPFEILRSKGIRTKIAYTNIYYDKFNLIVKYPSISESQKFGFPIEEGQVYKVVIVENPTSRVEAEKLLLVHPKSDDNTVVITQIEDSVLPYILREGKYSLRNELISITNRNDLEISLWFEDIQ